MTTKNDFGFADTDLVAYAPCGCWAAIMIESADFEENAKRVAQFARENKRDGVTRIERIPHSAFKDLRNGVNGDLTWGCDHDPQWGGAVSTHEDCPRCSKSVKIRKDGKLAAHKSLGGYATCSQEPWPTREPMQSASSTPGQP